MMLSKRPLLVVGAAPKPSCVDETIANGEAHSSAGTPPSSTAVAVSVVDKSKRQVRFDPSLDWDQEAKRTQRGAALRREGKLRRQLIKVQEAQRDTERRRVFLDLKNEDQSANNRRKLVLLYNNDESFRVNLNGFLDAVGAGVGHDNNIRIRLNHFQTVQRVQCNSLSTVALNYLGAISMNDGYINQFNPPTAARPSSSEDEDAEAFYDEFAEGVEADEEEEEEDDGDDDDDDDEEEEEAVPRRRGQDDDEDDRRNRRVRRRTH